MIDFDIPADLVALRDEIRAFVAEQVVPSSNWRWHGLRTACAGWAPPRGLSRSRCCSRSDTRRRGV
jgi:hypothetical protein